MEFSEWDDSQLFQALDDAELAHKFEVSDDWKMFRELCRRIAEKSSQVLGGFAPAEGVWLVVAVALVDTGPSVENVRPARREVDVFGLVAIPPKPIVASSPQKNIPAEDDGIGASGPRVVGAREICGVAGNPITREAVLARAAIESIVSGHEEIIARSARKLVTE